MAWTLFWAEHQTGNVLSNLDRHRQLSMHEVLHRVHNADDNARRLSRARDVIETKEIPDPPDNFIARCDPLFPRTLAHLRGAPFGVFVRGNTELLSNSGSETTIANVAIVGARRARPDSIAITHSISSQLGRSGICIVSGLALGIDGAAHQAAVEAGRPTVAVLGTGLDVVYPRHHKALVDRILKTGGLLVSEYAHDAEAFPMRFPARNRIIAGLSSYVVVVQAAERSGALQTVDFALDMGVDVGVVPSHIGDTAYAGSLSLLADGGRVIVNANSVLDDLGINLTPQSQLHEFGHYLDRPRHANDVAIEFNLSLADALSRLLDLELSGHILCSVDGKYCNAP